MRPVRGFIVCAAMILGAFPLSGDVLAGKIVNAKTGKPAAGVSVYLLANKTGVLTGEDGRFRLDAPAGTDTLRCRSLEYREKQLPVTIPGTVGIRLESDLPVLDAVEVNTVRPGGTAPHERTSASVNVITRADIPERAATPDEVLDDETGVDVRTLGGTGARAEVSIRGSSTEQVAVYLDGIPVSAGGSGFSGLGIVPLGQIDRIEVYRGASPGSFGAGAIGGVVNITTARTDAGNEVDVSASYGSFGTRHESALAAFGGALNRFLLSVGRNAATNDFRYYDDRGTTIDTSDDGWERRKNSDYESRHFFGRWDGGRKEGNAFGGSLSLTDTDRGVSGLGRDPALHARSSSQGILAQMNHRFRELTDTRIWYMRENVQFRDPDDEAGRRGRQDTDDRIEVTGLTNSIQRVFGPVLLHGNTELKREEFESHDAFDSAVTPPSRRISGGAGVEAEIMFASGALWISPRFHAAQISDRLQRSSLLLAQSTMDSTIAIDRTTTSWGLGARYRLSPRFTLRANGGVAARLPEFNELFGDTGDIVGNTDLAEERGRNADCGVHFASADRMFEADAGAFYRYAENLIQRRNYGDYLISENIGKAEIAGIEAWSGAEFFARRLSGRLSLTFQDARNRSDETVFRKQRYYGKLLPYHPRWKGSAEAAIRPRANVTARWKCSGESECFMGPSNLDDERLPARVIHSVTVRFEWHKRYGIEFDGENLTGDQSPDRWGYPKPGRGFYVTATARFSGTSPASGNAE